MQRRYLVTIFEGGVFQTKVILTYSDWYGVINDCALNGINVWSIVCIKLDPNPPAEINQ
jgi:hypothetical protein